MTDHLDPVDPPQIPLDAVEWLNYGIARGWCSLPSCATHDGVDWTHEEELAWDDGFDPCATVVRLL